MTIVRTAEKISLRMAGPKFLAVTEIFYFAVSIHFIFRG